MPVRRSFPVQQITGLTIFVSLIVANGASAGLDGLNFATTRQSTGNGGSSTLSTVNGQAGAANLSTSVGIGAAASNWLKASGGFGLPGSSNVGVDRWAGGNGDQWESAGNIDFVPTGSAWHSADYDRSQYADSPNWNDIKSALAGWSVYEISIINVSGSSVAVDGFAGSYLPVPGTLALLGVAGFVGSRRRR